MRAWWALDDGEVLELRDVRRFGRVAVVPRGRHDALPTLAALGPEPFAETFTPEVLWQGLRRSRLRVKTQLLQQRAVAGVGNIYADEALWRAGVDPAARKVTRPQAARLHAAIREVLAAGLANGGTTLRDYRTVDGGTGSNQHHLDCYGRAGQPCNRCGDDAASQGARRPRHHLVPGLPAPLSGPSTTRRYRPVRRTRWYGRRSCPTCSPSAARRPS